MEKLWDSQIINGVVVKLQFIEHLYRTTKYVILSGVRSTESKNLRLWPSFTVKSV